MSCIMKALVIFMTTMSFCLCVEVSAFRHADAMGALQLWSVRIAGFPSRSLRIFPAPHLLAFVEPLFAGSYLGGRRIEAAGATAVGRLHQAPKK